MKLIDKYIIKRSFLPFLYSILILLVLIFVIDLFENLEIYIKNKTPLIIILQYYIFLIPSYISQISSITILITVMYVLGNLSKYNEITALRAMGINILRITFPFLLIGLIFSLLMIGFNEVILPYSIFKYTLIEEKYIHSNSKDRNFYKNNIAMMSSNYSYLIKKYDIENKKMIGITILKYSQSKQVIARIDAQKAEWLGKGWNFYNGSIRTFNKKREANLETFKEKFIDFLQSPDFFKRTISFDLMNIRELYKYILMLKQNGHVPIRELVCLHEKIAFPFANFIILLIGIPIIFFFAKTGITLGIIISLISIFFYKIIVVSGIYLGNKGILIPFLAAWLGNIIFFIIGTIMFSKIRL